MDPAWKKGASIMGHLTGKQERGRSHGRGREHGWAIAALAIGGRVVAVGL